MSTSDLDLPLLPSAEQIRRREFATIRRGYDPDQVRDYLGSVALQVESLEKDLKDARLRVGPAPAPAAAPSAAPMPAAPESDPYERVSKRFAGLIATADREASRIVDEAKTDADRMRVDAQSTAEAIKQEGSDALSSAQAEADRVLAGLSTRREQLLDQLEAMQSRLLTVANDLGTVIEDAPTPDIEALGPEAESGEKPAAPVQFDEAGDTDDLLDPRYEDLWVSPTAEGDSAEAEVQLDELFGDADAGADPDAARAEDEVDDEDMEISMDIPDLASIELDFEQDRPDSTS